MCDRCVEWGDATWHLYGEYYHTGKFPMRKLHVEVAEKHLGPRPPGHDVHHIDEDTTNNDPSNLEYLPHGEHRRRHALGKIGSDLQRRVASEHLQRVWEERPMQRYVCEQCRTAFESRSPTPRRFCSEQCGEEWRRVPKFVPETRSCEVCGTGYLAKKSFQRYCSKRCSNRSTNKTFGKGLPESYKRGKRRTNADLA